MRSKTYGTPRRGLLAAATAGVLSASSLGLAGTPHQLVIALDGTRADGIINADAPNLKSIMNGTWASGYKTAYALDAQTLYDATTWSGPNHVAIMTGATGTQSLVVDNSTMTNTDYSVYPHYLKRLETAQPSLNTAYLYTWGTDSVIAPNADYSKNDSDANNATRAAGILAGTYSDANYTLGKDPSATFIFFDDIDHAGHTYGFSPTIPEYLTEIHDVDTQVGQMLTAIKNRTTFASEDWQIIVTADHGGLPDKSHNTSVQTSVANGNYSGGQAVANQTTIPFFVSSKTVSSGQLTGVARNYDVPTTALNFFGTAYPTSGSNALAGKTNGTSVTAVSPNLGTGLVTYLTFDNTLADTSGKAHNATNGANSDIAPTLHSTGGKFGGYVEINDAGGGTAASSYLTLGTPTDLAIADGTSFTVSFWFRSDTVQANDPVFLGNKNWASGKNKGFVMAASESGAGTGIDGVSFNAGDGTARTDLDALNFVTGAWNFMAVSYHDDGTAQLFTGAPNGTLQFIALDARVLGDLNSGLPLNIGQDGTGNYAYNIDADFDDLGIWRRALTDQEVFSLYANGAGAPISTLVPEPASVALLTVMAAPLLTRRRRGRR